MLLQIPVVHFFLLISGIPLNGYSAVYLSVLMGGSGLASFWHLQVKLP